jgi:L-alanine-DL-glutamate epimerase-like enolase superfamily enzyme
MKHRIFRWRLELANPFRIAHGTYSYRESVFLRLDVEGAAGLGEAPIVPYYGISTEDVEADLAQGMKSAATMAAVELACRVPAGSDLAGMPELAGLHFRYPVSRSAFQGALLSLRAKRLGEDLPAVLGIGVEKASPVPPTSFTVAYHDDPAEILRIAKASGFRRLKVKAGIPGDIDRITYLREHLPEAIIRVDANQGWSMEEAPGKLADLERLGIELVEEPIAGSPADFESLASGTSLPVILDESARDAEQVRRFAQQAPSVAGIVVKTAKNGGPLASLALARAAREAGMRVMVSCMVETSLGVSAALAIAPLCAWCDLDAPLLIANDPFTGLEYNDGIPRIAAGGLKASEEFAAYMGNFEVRA